MIDNLVQETSVLKFLNGLYSALEQADRRKLDVIRTAVCYLVQFKGQQNYRSLLTCTSCVLKGRGYLSSPARRTIETRLEE